jgi:ubiquinone biosynthesis protein Coq4
VQSENAIMKKKLTRLRTVILVFLTHQIALPLLKVFRKPVEFDYSREELKNFPAGTLGYDLYCFLEKRNLRLLKHYSRHDLKHVLLEYDTTDEGEACLQSFMLGNGRISLPVIATVIYSAVTMPEHWASIRSAFKKGRSARSIHNWKWNEVVHVSTQKLRDKIFKIN